MSAFSFNTAYQPTGRSAYGHVVDLLMIIRGRKLSERCSTPGLQRPERSRHPCRAVACGGSRNSTDDGG